MRKTPGVPPEQTGVPPRAAGGSPRGMTERSGCGMCGMAARSTAKPSPGSRGKEKGWMEEIPGEEKTSKMRRKMRKPAREQEKTAKEALGGDGALFGLGLFF